MSNKVQSQCLICNDVAIGINFGVPSCMPCKAFFRRNADKFDTKKFQCRHGENCLITFKYRGLCNSCRLAKCFRVGMKKSLILSNAERLARNKLIEANRFKRGKLSKQKSLQWMELPTLIRMPTNSIECLSSTDQIILANIFDAYESTCIPARNSQLPDFPSKPHTTVFNFLNELISIFPYAVKYLKHIPEFHKVSIQDQVRLIQNQFDHLMHINESILYPITSSNLLSSCRNIFEPNVTVRVFQRRNIVERYNVDPIILRIVLLIILFSSNNSRQLDVINIDAICDDTLTIFTAQNTYVELLWRYISSRSSSEYDLVKFFNRLILLIIFIQTTNVSIDCQILNSDSEIDQMIPLLRSMWPTGNKDRRLFISSHD